MYAAIFLLVSIGCCIKKKKKKEEEEEEDDDDDDDDDDVDATHPSADHAQCDLAKRDWTKSPSMFYTFPAGGRWKRATVDISSLWLRSILSPIPAFHSCY